MPTLLPLGSSAHMRAKPSGNPLAFCLVRDYEARILQKRSHVGVGHVLNTDTPQTRLHACPWGFRQIKNIFLILTRRGHGHGSRHSRDTAEPKKI